jgi:hypothetical protein
MYIPLINDVSENRNLKLEIERFDENKNIQDNYFVNW